MSSSQFEEKKLTDPASELDPLFPVSDTLLSGLRVQINPDTAKYVRMGDEKKSCVPTSDSEDGQHYVGKFYGKKGIVEFRGHPSFDFVFSDEDKADPNPESDYNSYRKKAVEYFGYTLDEVIFPSDAVWTGVVHSALNRIVKKKEPYLDFFTDFQVSVSFYKSLDEHNRLVYRWVNKGGENVFPHDPLAIVYHMFDDHDYIANPNPKFDKFYHLLRGAPEKLCRPLMEDATKILSDGKATADFSYCYSFDYEKTWEEMRVKFKTDRAKAEEEIQKKLMKNLFIFLHNLHSQEYELKKRVPDIIINGFEAARKHGIFIDLNYIPDEFKKDKKTVLALAGYTQMGEFLRTFENTTLDLALANAVKQADFVKAKEIADKMNKIGWRPSKSYHSTIAFINLLNLILSNLPPDFNRKNSSGNTLLDLATENPGISFKVVDALLNQKANPNSEEKQSPLHNAIKNRNSAVAKLLLAKSANPHMPDGYGRTSFETMLDNYLTDRNPELILLVLSQAMPFPEAYDVNRLSRGLKLFFNNHPDKKDLLLKTIDIQTSQIIKSALEKIVLDAAKPAPPASITPPLVETKTPKKPPSKPAHETDTSLAVAKRTITDTKEHWQKIVTHWVIRAQDYPILDLIHEFTSTYKDKPDFEMVRGIILGKFQEFRGSELDQATTAIMCAWWLSLSAQCDASKETVNCIRDIFLSMPLSSEVKDARDLDFFQNTYQQLCDHLRKTHREIKNWDATLRAGALAALAQDLENEPNLARVFATLEKTKTMELFSGPAQKEEIKKLYAATLPLIEPDRERIRDDIREEKLVDKVEIARQLIGNTLQRLEAKLAAAELASDVKSWWDVRQLTPKVTILKDLHASIGNSTEFAKQLAKAMNDEGNSITGQQLQECKAILSGKLPPPRVAPSSPKKSF